MNGWDAGHIAQAQFRALAKAYGFSVDTPIKDLPKNVLDIIFYGNDGDRIPMEYNSRSFSGFYHTSYEGVAKNLMRRYNETDSEMVKNEIGKYMKEVPCSKCGGKRLKPEALAVTLNGKNIFELSKMSVQNSKSLRRAYAYGHATHNRGQNRQRDMRTP